jgi:hypothetical protein
MPRRSSRHGPYSIYTGATTSYFSPSDGEFHYPDATGYEHFDQRGRPMRPMTEPAGFMSGHHLTPFAYGVGFAGYRPIYGATFVPPRGPASNAAAVPPPSPVSPAGEPTPRPQESSPAGSRRNSQVINPSEQNASNEATQHTTNGSDPAYTEAFSHVESAFREAWENRQQTAHPPAFQPRTFSQHPRFNSVDPRCRPTSSINGHPRFQGAMHAAECLRNVPENHLLAVEYRRVLREIMDGVVGAAGDVMNHLGQIPFVRSAPLGRRGRGMMPGHPGFAAPNAAAPYGRTYLCPVHDGPHVSGPRGICTCGGGMNGFMW